MTQIIKATIEDLPDILRMGRAFYYEAGWQDIYGEWSEEEASEALTGLIPDENAIIFMAKNPNSIGMIGGYVSPFWLKFKSIKMLSEFFWYVTPEERKGVGIQLKRAFDNEAIKRGVNVSLMASVENLPELDALYNLQGYRLAEKTFMKRLEW